MRKSILLFFLCTFCLIGSGQEIFSFDFQGDPTDKFIVYDLDGNTPTPAMQGIGFKVGTPWYPIRESASSENIFYGSTSSYIPAGQANDWLVTKALEIPIGGCVLEWKSQAYDPKKRDGLKIFVSTENQKVESFPKTSVWEVVQEEAGSANPDVIEGEWMEHSISLNEFAGKTVYIAFVNQSYDKSILFLDDVWVGRRADYEFSLTSEEYIVASQAEVTGLFRVLEDVTINSYTVHYSYGDNEYSKEYAGLNLKKDATHEFVFDEKIPLEVSKAVRYSVWVDVNGESSLKQNKMVTMVPYFPRRNVVIEEGTGTWCGNCVLGLWAMEYLRDEYGEDGFIGIGVHNGDPMTDKDYDKSLGLTAFPMGVVNRKVSCSPVTKDLKLQAPEGEAPDTFVDHYLKARGERTFGEINAMGTFNSDSTQIEAKATVNSVITVDDVDYRVAFVLIENGVKGYKQLNYYAGSTYPIGGYEKLPKSCDITFNDVACGIWPSFNGEKNSVPSNLKAGESIEYSYTITIPEKVNAVGHLELIALLINGETQEIMNAHRFPMTNFAHNNIETVESAGVKVFVNNGQLSVWVDSDNEIKVQLFDIIGNKIAEEKGAGNVTFKIPAYGYKGVAMLRIYNNNQVIVKKVNL